MAKTKSNKNTKKRKSKIDCPKPQSEATAPLQATDSSLVSIESINDLNNIPVGELFQLYNCNEHLQQSIETLCHTMHGLELYGCVKDQRDKECSAMSVKLVLDSTGNEHKIAQYTELIASLFPNVACLLVYYHPRLNTFFPQLIQRWRRVNNQLKIITLNGGSKSDQINTQWWLALSSFRSLAQINWFKMFNLPPAICAQVSMLSQLKSLDLTHYHGDVVPVIQQLGANLEWLTMEAHCAPMKFDLDAFEQLLDKHPHIGASLKYFKLDLGNPLKFSHLERLFPDVICKRFPLLESYYAPGFVNTPFSKVLKHLTRLPHMIDFTFDAYLDTLTLESTINLKPFTLLTRIHFGQPTSEQYTVEQFAGTIVPLFPNLKHLDICSMSNEFISKLNTKLKTYFPKIVTYTIALVDYMGVVVTMYEDSDCTCL